MRYVRQIENKFWPESIPLRLALYAVTVCLVAACVGCAVGRGDRSPEAMAGEPSAPVAYVPQGEVVRAEPIGVASPPQASPSIIQVRYSPSQETSEPATAAPLPEALAAPQATPAGISLDQAISATLLADPKIRAGLEAIHQANADSLTSSLPPNPTLYNGRVSSCRFNDSRRQRRAGRRKWTCMVGYPIDWFLFGKRTAAMASACFGVHQSEADYADLVRQRVTATATAYYDVLEAKSLLDLARQDTENLTRLEAATRKAVDAGGRPVVDLNRVRLDLLKSQQDLREAESALAVAKAKLRAVWPQRRRPILRRGRQSRRALDCGTVARRGSICPGAAEPS